MVDVKDKMVQSHAFVANTLQLLLLLPLIHNHSCDIKYEMNKRDIIC
jgi:hypothetical protein